MVYLQQEQRRHLGPGATTHVPAAEAILDGAEYEAETEHAAGASEALAARVRPPGLVDWGTEGGGGVWRGSGRCGHGERGGGFGGDEAAATAAGGATDDGGGRSGGR